MGPTRNAKGCDSGTVLRLQVASNGRVPMEAVGSVGCSGENVWGLVGDLRISRSDGVTLKQKAWETGYRGLPPTGSSATWDSTGQPGFPLEYECRSDKYFGYRARLNYRVKRSAVDSVGEGPYYVTTNWFKGKCK